MLNKKIILHIDMDSYFASVEQQAKHYLRGKPIVVSGKEGSRSVIVASSREAKKLGIKTGMLPFEAKKIFPKIIFVEPDGLKYEFLSRQIMEIFKKYTDKVQIFSIDEAFLDLTGYVKNFDQAIFLAEKIKKDIKSNLGEWVTCSIGLADNKLLAKLASDMNKPNGLFLIDEKNKDSILLKTNLTDFCGIGRGLSKHLNSLGIDSVLKLQKYPKDKLIKIFGPFCGNKLHNISFGVDDDPVISYINEQEVKSIGRAHTLPTNTGNKQEILAVLLHLCESAGRELRRKNLAGKTIIVYWRYDDFTHGGMRKTLAGYLNQSLKIYEIGKQKILDFKFPKQIRLVGVHISNLVKNYNQLSLWEKDRKQLNLTPALDKINDTYGELTIKPTYLLKLKKLRNKVGGFKLK